MSPSHCSVRMAGQDNKGLGNHDWTAVLHAFAPRKQAHQQTTGQRGLHRSPRLATDGEQRLEGDFDIFLSFIPRGGPGKGHIHTPSTPQQAHHSQPTTPQDHIHPIVPLELLHWNLSQTPCAPSPAQPSLAPCSPCPASPVICIVVAWLRATTPSRALDIPFHSALVHAGYRTCLTFLRTFHPTRLHYNKGRQSTYLAPTTRPSTYLPTHLVEP